MSHFHFRALRNRVCGREIWFDCGKATCLPKRSSVLVCPSESEMSRRKRGSKGISGLRTDSHPKGRARSVSRFCGRLFSRPDSLGGKGARGDLRNIDAKNPRTRKKKFPRPSLGPGMSRPSLTKENDSIPRSGTVQTEGRAIDLIT